MIVVEGNIANHDTKNFHGLILIDEKTGLIVDVSSKKPPKDRFKHIKIPNSAVIYPGFIDIHTHAREDETKLQNYKETYHSIAKAALNGGLTCIAVMPNTPNPLTTEKQFNWHRDKVNQMTMPKPNILNYVAVSPKGEPLKKTIFIKYM